MSYEQQLRDDAIKTGDAIKTSFEDQMTPASRLAESMIYATMNGGKRLRAALVLGAARLAGDGVEPVGALRVAAALEMIHAYSLVHDDLPAMDDADTRRGQPSCHIAYDEATAILAGDALQTLAFEVLANPATHDDAGVRADLVLQLARASGLAGMAGGQMLDLEAETRPFDLDDIQRMQSMKTGALIQCAAACGGIVGGADQRLMDALLAFSGDLGLAFQIADDLLDYQGDAATIGKPTQQDADRGKGSFVSLMGVDEARHTADRLIEDAIATLSPWPEAGYLAFLAKFAIVRRS